jgi:hypothetical protein
MKRQPGFIWIQRHRAIGESPTYLNYAVWESTADFRAEFTHPEFMAKLSVYPSSAVAAPHLFQKVAVPGVWSVARPRSSGSRQPSPRGPARLHNCGCLDRQHQPRPGRMLQDPGQCLGVAGTVVAERAGGDHRAARVGTLELIGVTVRVRPDDPISDGAVALFEAGASGSVRSLSVRSPGPAR